jgi:hypothetical protein
MNNIPKSARTLALCGDHSNYTFEQAGYYTAGRVEYVCFQQRVPLDICFENRNRYVILFLM